MGDSKASLEPSAKLTIWNKTFICVFVAQAFLSLSQGSVNILIARYAGESLGVSPVVMGNLVGLYFGVALAMRPVAGPLQTKLDKRKLLIAVYLTGGIVNLGYAFFNTTAAFATFRVIQGIQYGFMGSLIMTIAVDSLPQERMASGVAMYGLGGTIMQAIAPNIGLWLRDMGPKLRDSAEGLTLGYRMAFVFAASILALALIPLIIMPYKKASKEEIASTGAWYKNIISKHTLPITLVVILAGTANSGYRSFLDAFANEVGIRNIGLFSTTTALVMLFARPLSGWIMDRHSMKKVLPIGMAFIGVALVVISNSRTLPVILIGAALASFGNGFVTPGLHAMCVQTEGPNRRAVATNTLYAGIDLGQYMGPVWGGIVVARYDFSVSILSGIIPLFLAFIFFLIFVPGWTRRKEKIESSEL